MTYEQWAKERNSDSALLRECWEAAQADIKAKLAERLGEDNGYIQRKFYPRLADAIKEIN